MCASKLTHICYSLFLSNRHQTGDYLSLRTKWTVSFYCQDPSSIITHLDHLWSMVEPLKFLAFSVYSFFVNMKYLDSIIFFLNFILDHSDQYIGPLHIFVCISSHLRLKQVSAGNRKRHFFNLTLVLYMLVYMLGLLILLPLSGISNKNKTHN